jgi:hypothetical protein
MDDLEELTWRKRNVDDAKEALEAFIQHRWPEGSPVTWLRGGHLQYGEVVHKAYGDRVKVRNDMSGRSYWITLYDLEQALKITTKIRAAA